MPKVSGAKGKKVQQFMINGVTFPENDKDQRPLCPGEARYCDYFWVGMPVCILVTCIMYIRMYECTYLCT